MDEILKSKLLAYFSIICQGDWGRIYELIQKREMPDDDLVEETVSKLRCKYVTMLNPDYPRKLYRMIKPPIVLFYYGDLSLANEDVNTLAVIGSREPTAEGVKNTIDIVSNLNKDTVVVSGLASGIDGIAHKAAIDSGHKTIAVLGSGIDLCFPTENESLYWEIRKKGLVLSEYPGRTPPIAYHFPVRNRIVAGLGDGVLVTDCAIRSGTMITVGMALNAGKPVYAVPSSNLNNSGCNLLIKEGCDIVENAEEIEESMAAWRKKLLREVK